MKTVDEGMSGSFERLEVCYRLLKNVYTLKAYSSIELDKELKEIVDSNAKKFITSIFYGTLENDSALDYYINKCAPKRPKPSVAVLLKLGIYLIKYSDMPQYAAINQTVELAKKLGKSQLSGFINAILRKAASIELPDKSSISFAKYLSYYFKTPVWIAEKIIKEYGENFAEDFFKSNLDKRPHFRLIGGERDEKLKALSDSKKTAEGFYADYNEVKKSGIYCVIQSEASALASAFYCKTIKRGDKVLDLCSAPGGKAVYIAEKTSADVTACDIYLHRLNLISAYAKAANVNLTLIQNDAEKQNDQFFDSFDSVICDVPCSGLGVRASKPDIYLNRKPEDIVKLTQLQYKILSVSADYVKAGGYLNYSTCTVLKEENEEIINKFLTEHKNFQIEPFGNDGFFRLYPQTDGCDGFFAAKLKRIV